MPDFMYMGNGSFKLLLQNNCNNVIYIKKKKENLLKFERNSLGK